MNFHFKNINDIKIAYKDVGKGKVIFCLPPFPSSSASFIPFINKVKKQFRVIALDLPGFGGYSSLPEKNFTLNQYLKIIEKFILSFKLKKYYLLGYSFGGALAINIVKRKSIIPQKLILVSAFYDGKDVFKYKPYIKYLRFFKKIKAKSLLNNLYTTLMNNLIKVTSYQDYIKIKNENYTKQLFKENKNMSLSASYCLMEQLKESYVNDFFYDIPTLVIYSENDLVFIKKQMEILSKNPKITSYFVKDADHRHFFFKVKKSVNKIVAFINKK